MAADPLDVGERVLAALNAGRERAIAQARAQAAVLERAVRREIDRDILRGNPGRGRAGRIAESLRGRLDFVARGERRTSITRAGVARILQRLSSDCTPLSFNGASSPAEHTQ